jgi:predicted RNase H-like HicB family nuclease
MKKVKTLEYYLALPYTIEAIPDEGAWFVRIKELSGCMTEVDSWEEILPAIEEAKRLWLELALERGRTIPEAQQAPA